MRSTNSIKDLMDTTLNSIKTTIDANTIIGDPIKAENTIVVPISKVTIGFGIGGGEYSRNCSERKREEKKTQIFVFFFALSFSIIQSIMNLHKFLLIFLCIF